MIRRPPYPYAMKKLSLFAAVLSLAPAARAGLFGPEKFCRSEVPEERASYISFLRQNSPQESWTYTSSICLSKDKSVKGVSVQNAHLFGEDGWHWVDIETLRDHQFSVGQEASSERGVKGPWVARYFPAMVSDDPNYAGDIVADAAQDVYLLVQAEANARRLQAPRQSAQAACSRHANFAGQAGVQGAQVSISVCLAGEPALPVGVSYRADGGAWKWLWAEDLFSRGLALTQSGLVEMSSPLDEHGGLKIMKFAPELGRSEGYDALGVIEREKTAAVSAKVRKAAKAPVYQ